MYNTTARCRLPNGKVLRVQVAGKTINGYRRAYAQVRDELGNKVTVSGRVSAKRGFSEYDRIHKFEVNMNGQYAYCAFLTEDKIYAVAA